MGYTRMKRSGFLQRGTPIRNKRTTPRRKAPERVQAVRQKPKAGARPTAEERRHMDRVAAMPCLVAAQAVIESRRCRGRTTLHHVSAPITRGRIARSHKRVVPLCERHHLIQEGPHESVEALGHEGFHIVYGIDLLAEGNRLWEESCG